MKVAQIINTEEDFYMVYGILANSVRRNLKNVRRSGVRFADRIINEMVYILAWNAKVIINQVWIEDTLSCN